MGFLLRATFARIRPIGRLTIASLTLLVGCSRGDLALLQGIPPSPPATARIAPSVKEISDQSLGQPIPLKETLVLPGERVGPVTRDTSRKDLVKMFGATRLRDRTVSDPEGIDTLPATLVDLGPKQSLTIVWQDIAQTKPAYIRDLGVDWQTPEGSGMGTSFADLRKQLGKFQLYGLAWDYGGTILLQGTELSRYEGKLILQVKAAPQAAKKFPKDYQAVVGDRRFSSSNSHWQRLGLRVGVMTVVLNEVKGK
ncbi:MAG: hypothetical protein WCA35_30470 [Kovacikia sp.]